MAARSARNRSAAGQRRAVRAALAVAAAAVVVPLAGGPAAGGAVAPVVEARVAVATRWTPGQVDDDGLLIQTTSEFQVDPDGRAVHVAVDLTLTNQLGPRYFFPRLGYPVLAEAVDVGATRSDGRALPVRVETVDQFVSFADIDLTPDLESGERQSIRLTFDLPSLPPRSPGFTRVNPAFVTFPAFALGDAGEVDVRIRIPEGLESEVVGEPMTKAVGDGETVYSADALPDPLAWNVVVVARDDDALVTRSLAFGDQEVIVRAWPDDGAWAEYVDGQLQRGLPVLERLIGQDWPTDAPLEIIETAAPYAYGYAGWYWTAGNTIEIGDEFLPDVIFHEVAHMWFNDRLFSERWVNEAFAEEFSWRTLTQLGETAPPPDPVVPDDPAAFPLNLWDSPSLVDRDSDAREAYGYNTAWSVLHQVAEEIGLDGLAAVVDAVTDQEIAYQGDGEPETLSTVTGWRRLLDLLQEIGGSQQAEALFASHVATEREVEVFPERSRLRAEYSALVAAGEGWTAPREVRTAMGAWRFDDAEDLIAEAEAVLEIKDDLIEAGRPLGLEVPAGLEAAYEGDNDLGAVAALAAAHQFALEEVVAADAALAEDRDLFETIGFWGSDAADDLERAARAYEDGDAAAAAALAASVADEAEAAAGVGQRRVAAGGGALLALALATVAVGRIRRLHRNRPAAADEGVEDRAGDAAGEMVEEPSP